MGKRGTYFLFSVATVLAVLLMVEFGARVIYSFYYRGPEALMYGFRYSNLGAINRARSVSRREEWKTKAKDNFESIDNKKGAGRLNSYGFVGPDFPVSKAEGVFRIVAMGGSTTQGKLGIAGTRVFPYTAFLQEIFNRKRGGKKVEVLNAGVAGIKIRGIYRRIRDKVLPLDPDLIILSIGWDDLRPITNMVPTQSEVSGAAQSPLERRRGQNNRKMLIRWYVSRASFTVVDRLSRFSLLVTGMRAVARRFLIGSSSVYLDNRSRKKMARVIATHPLFSTYERYLEKTIRLLRKRRICVLLLRAPYKYPARHFKPPNRLYYMYPLPRLYGIIEKVAEKYQVPVANVETYFNRLPEKEILFGDLMHMTSEGYGILASFIHRIIVDGSLLEKKGCGGGVDLR